LRAISNHNPQILIISGDIADEEGQISAYEWVGKQVKNMGIPCALMAGNHDVLHNMTEIFKLKRFIKNDKLYYKKQLRGHIMLFLDTSSSVVDKAQLQWIRRESRTALPNEILLFIHHPPIYSQCSFMDKKYPLKNRKEVWQVLLSIPNLKHIFCGHYHTEKMITQDGRLVYLTPSTMAQIDQESPLARLEHKFPGWRLIKWNGNNLMTRVYYVYR
jgi:Icc protein